MTLAERIAAAQMRAFPVLEPRQARDLADAVLAELAEPVIIGSGLELCSLCRAPTRAKERRQ